MSDPRPKVLFLMRSPNERSFSIEAVFRTVASALPEDLQHETIVSPYPSRGFLPRLRAMLFVRKACRDADVIHMTGDAHFLVLFLPKSKVVLTIHDCEFLERTKGLKRLVLWLFWIKLPIARSGCITVVSEASKRQLLSWVNVGPGRITVVENPMSNLMPPAPPNPKQSKTRLLMIGAAAHKNIERTVKALVGLPVQLTIVGRLDASRLKDLRDTGVPIETVYDLSDEDLRLVYQHTDIVMFPSLKEGFGLPILEGQSTGRPVITSNRSPMSDVAGNAAILVDPDDENAIRGAVIDLISDPDLCETLTSAGFENIKRFSPDIAAVQYAAIYRQVVAQQ